MINGKTLVSLVAKAFPDAVFFKEIEDQAKTLALTIDDIPARDDDSDLSTQNIIEVIDQHNQKFPSNVKVTFFITTNHLTDDSNIVEQIDARGHEIGNHGTTDHRHSALTEAEFQDEFQQAHQILADKVTQPIRWFRPAQGFYNHNMLQTLKIEGKALGYQDKFALASMIPFDTLYFLDAPKFTLKNIHLFTFPGSILLLHGGKKNQALNTIEVLKILLPQLHEQGYQLVTLSELFSQRLSNK